MEDTPTILRKLVEQQPKKLKPFCKEAGLPYFRMRDFMSGRGPGLRLEQAERLCMFLTNEPIAKLADHNLP